MTQTFCLPRSVRLGWPAIFCFFVFFALPSWDGCVGVSPCVVQPSNAGGGIGRSCIYLEATLNVQKVGLGLLCSNAGTSDIAPFCCHCHCLCVQSSQYVRICMYMICMQKKDLFLFHMPSLFYAMILFGMCSPMSTCCVVPFDSPGLRGNHQRVRGIFLQVSFPWQRFPGARTTTSIHRQEKKAGALSFFFFFKGM